MVRECIRARRLRSGRIEHTWRSRGRNERTQGSWGQIMYKPHFTPNYAIHPGELLEWILKGKGLEPTEEERKLIEEGGYMSQALVKKVAKRTGLNDGVWHRMMEWYYWMACERLLQIISEPHNYPAEHSDYIRLEKLANDYDKDNKMGDTADDFLDYAGHAQRVWEGHGKPEEENDMWLGRVEEDIALLGAIEFCEDIGRSELQEVVDRLRDFDFLDGHIRTWLSKEQRLLKGKTAAELILNGHGDEVLQLIDRLEEAGRIECLLN